MILVLALFVGSWLLLVSCGGGGSAPATTTTTTTSATTTTTIAGFHSVSGSIARGSVEAGVLQEIIVLLANNWDDPLIGSPAMQVVTLEASSDSVAYQLIFSVTQEGYYWLFAAADFDPVSENPRYLDVYGWDHASDPFETTPSIEVTGDLIDRDLSLFDRSGFPD